MRTLNYVVAFVLVLFVAFGSVACDSDGGGSPSSPSSDPDPAHAPSGDGGFRFKGEVPVATGMDHLGVTGRGSVGTINDVSVCVWDNATEDGDLINIWVADYTLTAYGSDVIELFHEEVCWSFDMQTGYYYPIRILALNTGSIGPNTGAVSVTIGQSSDTQVWDVPLNTNAEASIVIFVP